MSKININPYDTLTGVDGLPLDQGYIYIGMPNLDPKTNPMTVYWDAALTQPVNQPIRTLNGRVWNAGSIALIYAASNYSVQVLDKNQAQVLLALSVALPVDNPVPITQGGTGATTAAGALANLGVISALVQQTYTGYTTSGISSAFTLTPAPAIAASPARTRFNVTFHTAGSGAPTLSISGLVAKFLKQYDSLGAKTTAIIKTGQIADIIDDGVDYLLLDPLPSASAGGIAGAIVVRQSPQLGVRDSSGNAAFLTAGAALNFNVNTSVGASPLTLAFANGEGATGALDLTSVLSADAPNQGALAPNNINYVYASYVNAGSVTWGNTRAPWQDGRVYDRTRQALLQFGGVAGSTAFPDDFGNSWTAQGGAKIQTNYFKYGTGALGGAGATNALNGVADFVKATNFNNFGVGPGWAMRSWVKPLNALPGASVAEVVLAATNAGGFGAYLAIYNNAGTIRFAYFLSSNGTTFDIASAVQGTTLPVLNTEYFVELTYDSLAGVYRLYVNGIQEQSTTSAAKLCGVTAGGIGAVPATGPNSFFQGYIDKPEFLPYCEHPGGTGYAAPAGAPVITTPGYASEWYDYVAGVMKTISAASVLSGTDPAFTPVQKLYCGECDTNGANVTVIRNYAYLGSYDSDWATFPNAATFTSRNSGIGTDFVKSQVLARNRNTEGGYSPGDNIFGLAANNGGTTVPVPVLNGRNTTGFTTGSVSVLVATKATGVLFALTPANWQYKISVERAY